MKTAHIHQLADMGVGVRSQNPGPLPQVEQFWRAIPVPELFIGLAEVSPAAGSQFNFSFCWAQLPSPLASAIPEGTTP